MAGLIIKRIAGGMGVQLQGEKVPETVTARTVEDVFIHAGRSAGILSNDDIPTTAQEAWDLIDALLTEGATQILEGTVCA
jgi:hypothetical protein